MCNKLSQQNLFASTFCKIIFYCSLLSAVDCKIAILFYILEVVLTTGFTTIQLIEAMIDGQVRSATLARDRFAKFLAGQVGQVFGGNLDPERQSALFKALRMKNPLNEVLIAESLPWIPSDLPDSFKEELKQVEKLSAEAHQARTQAAFVSGVLKPFNPKIIQRWADERTDVNVNSFKEKIDYLQNQNLVRVDQLIGWGDDVAELFKDLVVVDEAGNDLLSRKPFGTVSRPSSRTYVQSWLAFIRRHSGQILEGKSGSASSTNNLGEGESFSAGSIPPRIKLTDSLDDAPRFASLSSDKISKSPMSSYQKSEVNEFLGEAASQIRKLQMENESLRALAPRTGLPKVADTPPFERNVPNVEAYKPGLKICAEATSGEKSTCYFENLGSAQLGISMWIETLKQIWADQAESVKFRAEARVGDEQFSFDLPKFALDEAAEKLMPFTARLAGISHPK